MKSNLILSFGLLLLLGTLTSVPAYSKVLTADVLQCAQAVYNQPLPITTLKDPGHGCSYYVNTKGVYELSLGTISDVIKERGTPMMIHIPPDPPTCILSYSMDKNEPQTGYTACPSGTRVISYTKLDEKDLTGKSLTCILAKAIKEIDKMQASSKEDALAEKKRIEQVEVACQNVIETLKELNGRNDVVGTILGEAKSNLTKKFNIQFAIPDPQGQDQNKSGAN